MSFKDSCFISYRTITLIITGQFSKAINNLCDYLLVEPSLIAVAHQRKPVDVLMGHHILVNFN